MFRIVGFIVGCAASAGLLLLLMGTPDFHLGEKPADAGRYDRAIDKLREKRRLEATEAASAEDERDAGIPNASSEAATEPEVADAAPPAAVAAEHPEAAEPLLEPPLERRPAVVPEARSPDAPDPAWHTFWNPFRSEVAATGFVRRLENVTGLDYRIAKVKAGVYEVAFAYQSDDELTANLAQISAATGLDLSDTLP